MYRGGDQAPDSFTKSFNVIQLRDGTTEMHLGGLTSRPSGLFVLRHRGFPQPGDLGQADGPPGWETLIVLLGLGAGGRAVLSFHEERFWEPRYRGRKVWGG